MRDIVDRRYRIEQKLAAGGFGAIYRATDLAIGRSVALKVLHRELAGDANVVARFRREAAALATLKSPHTLTLYDVGETDDTLYLVMELLRGESLQELFDRSGPLGWERMARIARGVCSSLIEAHAHGIVHRDLKPANIFLETHALDVDYVKVLDFGIAKILESSDLANVELTRTGQMIGTFDYMAPEQMIGGRTTAKSDVFTLGVVMFEMISGRRPFGDAPGPAAMLMALLQNTPAPLTGVPDELRRIVMSCLASEQDDRPDIAALDAALARLLDSLGTADGDVRAAAANDADDDEDDDDDDDGTFRGDDDDVTLVDDQIMQATAASRRITRPRGSVMPMQFGGELAQQPRVVKPLPLPVVRFQPPRVHTQSQPSTQEPSIWARGSETEVAPARHDDDPAPPTRMATGTSPIVNEPVAPPTASNGTAGLLARSALIAAVLFGIGFAVALFVASSL